MKQFIMIIISLSSVFSATASQSHRRQRSLSDSATSHKEYRRNLSYQEPASMPLQEAVRARSLSEVKNTRPSAVNLHDYRINDGNTGMHIAAENGDLSILKILKSLRADVNAQNDIGRQTPLYLAARAGNCEVISWLIENGAEVNLSAITNSPLHVAIVNKKIPAADLLISRGANVNKTDFRGETPLHYAARYNCLEVVKKLIENGANINAQDKKGLTPLHEAYKYNHQEIVDFLLSTPGINQGLKDKEGKTPKDYETK